MATLRLPNGICKEVSFLSQTPLASVRRWIANDCQVPTELVRLGIAGKDVTDKRAKSAISRLRSENIDVLNDRSQVTVKIRSPGKTKIKDVSLLDRVYDLRLKFAKQRPADLHTFELALGETALRDRATLGSLGFYSKIEIQCRKVKRRVRLSFVDLHGNTLGYQFEGDETLHSIAGRFHDEPFAVAFEFEDAPLPRMTSVFDAPCDPDRPITVVLRELRVRIRREREVSFCEVDENTTAEGLVERLRSNYAKRVQLSLGCEGRNLENRKILDLFPDLDAILDLVVVPGKLTQDDLDEFSFSFPGTQISDHVQPFAKYDTTVGKVKPLLANKLEQPPTAVGVYFEGALLADDDLLFGGRTYQVKVENYRFYTIALCRGEADRPNPKFKRVIPFVVAGKAKLLVSDLARHLRRTPGLPDTCAISFADGKEVSLTKTLEKPSGNILYANLPPLRSVARYSFRRLGPGESPEIRDITVNASQSVRDLKPIIARSLTRVLPDVLELSFWSVKLSDSEPLLSYGIPDRSTIDFYDRNSFEVRLRFDNSDSFLRYLVSGRNKVADLKQFVGNEQGRELSEIVFESAGKELDDGAFFLDIDSREIDAKERLHEHVLASATGSIHLHLTARATVGDALGTLAVRLECDAQDVILSMNGHRIADPQAGFCDLAGALTVSLASKLAHVTFQFQGASHTLDVEPESLLGDLLPDLRTHFGLAPLSPLEFWVDSCDIDSNMTIAESEFTDFELAIAQPRPKPKPKTKGPTPSEISVPAGLETEAAPFLATFSFPPETPLSEVLAKFAAHWRTPYEVDMVLEGKRTGARVFPDLTARLDTLDLANNYVIITHPRLTEVLVETVPVHPPVQEVDESEATVLRTGGARDLSEKPAGVTYAFSCEQRNEEFTLSFERSNTVGHARAAVGVRFGLKPEFVTLLHMGKPLKDGFLLDRLRLGRQAIRIYLKDDSEVNLLTAAAMLH
jgi:hypothetical protein